MSNAGGFKSLTRYYDMLAGNTVWNPWSPAGAYESIATVTVGSGGSASVTFSGIPSTYTHLQVRGIASSGTGGGFTTIFRYNSDSAANYTFHRVEGDGSSAAAAAGTGRTNGVLNYTVSTNLAASVMDILDYTSTSKTKTTRILTGNDNNGSGYVGLYSSAWLKTPEAITSITLSIESGYNFAQYSSFALFGIRGN